MWTDTPFRKIFPKQENIGNLGKFFLNFPVSGKKFPVFSRIFLEHFPEFSHFRKKFSCIFLNFPGTFSYSGKIFLLCGQKFDHQKQGNPGKSRKIRDFFSYLGKLFFTVILVVTS